MNYKHGKAGHGKSRASIYGIWCSMKSRCLNKNTVAYKDYGGRGITVCERWMTFANFYEDMGDKPDGMSIERKDNDLGYCKENCEWAPMARQAQNRRSARIITARGVSMSMTDWAKASGIRVATIWHRISIGWPEDDAVTVPLIKDRRGFKPGDRKYTKPT